MDATLGMMFTPTVICFPSQSVCTLDTEVIFREQLLYHTHCDLFGKLDTMITRNEFVRSAKQKFESLEDNKYGDRRKVCFEGDKR